MHLPDIINGTFECLAGVFQASNCWRLFKDKVVHGVNWQVTAFCVVWGCYNIYYYQHLGQTVSWYGGLVVLAANAVWVAAALHYGKVAHSRQ